jgi:hypothetical protein
VGVVTGPVVVGVDPGAAGAIVALDEAGTPALAWAADDPECGYFVAGDPDPLAITARLRPLAEVGVLRVVFESAFAPAQVGTANALTIGRRWGMLYAALRACRMPVVVVTPAAWSRALWGASKGGTGKERKQAAVRLAAERAPALGLVLPGRRIAHDGLADAAALAIYGWERA